MNCLNSLNNKNIFNLIQRPCNIQYIFNNSGYNYKLNKFFYIIFNSIILYNISFKLVNYIE